MADSSNPWTKHGVLSIPGVPAPSGPYNVIGCEDVMTDTGLLVRLFYPSSDQDGLYQYAEARPHPNYTRASFDLFGFEPIHWMTLLVNHLTGIYTNVYSLCNTWYLPVDTCTYVLTHC